MTSSLRAVLALSVLLLGSAAAPHAAPVSAPVTFNVNSVNDVVADFTGDHRVQYHALRRWRGQQRWHPDHRHQHHRRQHRGQWRRRGKQRGNLTLFDSTLSNNSVSHDGGGIYNYNAGTARIFHTTIAGNLADNQALQGGLRGGGIYNSASIQSVQIWNSLLAYNFSSKFDSQCGGFGPYSQDYNYIALNGSCPLTGTTTHNLKFGDPLLGSLADNGGPHRYGAREPRRQLLRGRVCHNLGRQPGCGL